MRVAVAAKGPSRRLAVCAPVLNGFNRLRPLFRSFATAGRWRGATPPPRWSRSRSGAPHSLHGEGDAAAHGAPFDVGPPHRWQRETQGGPLDLDAAAPHRDGFMAGPDCQRLRSVGGAKGRRAAARVRILRRRDHAIRDSVFPQVFAAAIRLERNTPRHTRRDRDPPRGGGLSSPRRCAGASQSAAHSAVVPLARPVAGGASHSIRERRPPLPAKTVFPRLRNGRPAQRRARQRRQHAAPATRSLR